MNRRLAAGLVLGIGATALLVWGGQRIPEHLPGFTAWLERLGWLAPAGFALGYAVAVVLLVPGSLLTMLAGALFGVVGGALAALTGAVLGSALAFSLARGALRGRVARWLGNDPRLVAIDAALAEGGTRLVLLLRLSPLVPFSALNFLLGLTRIPLGAFLAGSVGMIPGSLAYALAGQVAGEAVLVASGGAAGPEGTWRWVLAAAGAIASLALVWWVGRLVSRALGRVLPAGDPRTR